MNELAMKLGRPPQPGVSSATRRVRRRIRTFARRRRFRALRASTTHRRRRRRRHRSARAPPLTSSSLRTARPGRTARRASTLFPSRPRGPSRRPGVVLVPVRVHRGDIRQPIVLRVTRHRAMSLTVSHPRTRPLSSLFVSRLSRLSPFALVSASSPTIASHRIPSHPIASHRIASNRITHESHVLPELVRVTPRRLEQGPKHGWVILVLRHRVGRSSFARHRRSSLARATHDERETDRTPPSFALPRAFPAPLAPARASLRRPGARVHRRARHPPDLVVAPRSVPRAHAVGRHDPRFHHRARPIGDPPSPGLGPRPTRDRARADAC